MAAETTSAGWLRSQLLTAASSGLTAPQPARGPGSAQQGSGDGEMPLACAMARAACGMSDIELLAVVVVLPLVFVAELGWPMAWLLASCHACCAAG